MKKKLGSLLAAAALSGTIGINVQAEEITVQKGDTLWGLAKVHNASVDDIIAWNGLTSDRIYAGERLNIHPETMYVVQKGDTLWNIAKQHSITLQQLVDWNDLKGDLIVPGMKLAITGPAKAVSPTANQSTPVSKPQINTQSTPTKQVSQPKVKAAPAAKQEAKTNGKELAVTATAYTAYCEGCSGITATGINLKNNPGAKVIAVDPSVIPLGTKVFVEGYGEAIAGDTGGAIKGNKIDVFIPSRDAALKWGVKKVKVTILE
ncbi:peptidoglycan-binding protein [Bacillus sp. FJAT-27225]|uniref:LysM peptidoglycan-binding and 3D domain-containing protein n=1 Tax=Bacillus sp. FJAT-27225 TaxID=1743144 RepID=UPI00080C3575|nr:3D domain-containing protein [Bacillus sp. FJAT-27225]OCA90768.1 peptidoglycan-binding protein [Bacillus sp. FJAT-27225]